jgi:aminobenzoyl-glutamate utilization protein B
LSKKYINWIESNRERLIEINNQIWEFAEIGFQEKKSSKLLANTLKEAGFSVEMGVADMPTAFYASYGSGKPVIAILGEYDALPGLSQVAEPVKKPLKEGAPGHGCGHNLLGVGSLGGVLAVKEAIDAGEANGTIRYYGCPAEERFNSKGMMIKAGLFDDVDISMTWHPAFMNMIIAMPLLSLNSVFFKFHGRTSHAAVDPYNGRSALDAVELMNVGANYMREHILPDARLHYIITNGGDAPNIVPAEAEVYYFVRAPERHQVEEIYNRLIKVAEGAALMTETELEIDFVHGMHSTKHNEVVSNVILANMKKVHAPKFNNEEHQFAEKLSKTLVASTMEGYVRLLPQSIKEMARQIFSQPLSEMILPTFGKDKILPGSSDVGDVSCFTPTGQFTTTCFVMGAPAHSWQNVCTAGMSIGHKGMLMAAKVLALSAIEFMNNPELVQKARKEFEETTKDHPYKSPFPEGFKPPIHRFIKED